ncbi:MAG: aminotransferase class V-fold PLP-dependent enzyme [Candidatus Cyclobacteriaceae bacterium M3_2C_046]
MSHSSLIGLDIDQIRSEFPILHQEVNGRPLVYFDNAATTQKPRIVIDAINDYYRKINSNIHRGVHTLAERSTEAFEDTRQTVQSFINAEESEEIIFTKGTTEGINLIASSYGRKFLQKGDEVIISAMEHHSNIVPWQMICEEKEAKLKVIPVNDQGELIWDSFEKLLSERTRLVSVVYASNALGTINPVQEIIEKAHEYDAVVMIDAAQAAPHLSLDVQAMDCDFMVFSGHKMYGPTGTGIVYGKRKILEQMPPYQGGGEMIKEVSFEKTTYNDIPFKFEAGTPNIGDSIALKMAIEFINQIGKEQIASHEAELLQYAHQNLSSINGLRLVGTASRKVSVVSFVFDHIHPFDVGMMLDARGVAVRTGHHCTQPLMSRYGLEGTVRASFAVYNTKPEIDQLVEGLEKIVKMMK